MSQRILRSFKKSKSDDENYVKLDKISGIIYVMGEITPGIASDFRQFVQVLTRSKNHTDIIVEINSPGGDIEAGLMMIDTIRLSAKPVTTRVTGVAMSMAALILAAGGHREATPMSTIMVHQGIYKFSSTFDEIEVESSECIRLEHLCNEFLDKATQRPPGYWAQRHNGKNLYLTAEQALQEGLIHSIMKKKKEIVPNE